MPRTIDLNEESRPTLLFIMKDENKTKVHITTPSVALVKELRRNLTQLQEVMKGAGPETNKAVYTLAAKLINCNLDFFKTTGEELETKYHVSVHDLIIFYTAYLEFLQEIDDAKN